jgi:hypothetical protein
MDVQHHERSFIIFYIIRLIDDAAPPFSENIGLNK